MAQESNIIQVVIESVNKMSADLQRLDAEMGKFQGTTDRTAKSTGIATTQSVRFHQALMPLNRAIGTVSNAAARLNPEIGILVSNLDNLTFAAVRAASHSQTAGGAILAAFKAVFNPVTLIVIGSVTALSYFMSKMIESREQAEKLNIAFRMGNVGAFSQAIMEIELKLDKAKQRLVEVMNALKVVAPSHPGGPPLPQTSVQILAAQKEVADIEKQRAELGAKERELRERDFNKEFPIIEKNLQTQLMMNKTLDERIKIMVDMQTAQLRVRGASEEAIAALEPDITRIETLKQLKVEMEKHAEALKEMRRIEEEEAFSHRDLQEVLVKTDWEAYEERLKLLEDFRRKREEEFTKMTDIDLLDIQRGPEELFKLVKKAEEEAEEAADQYAKTFADRLVSAMEGEKMDIQGIFRSIGRVAMIGLIEELTKMAILGPLKEIFASEALSGGKSKGGLLGGLLGGIFGSIFRLFGAGSGTMLPGNFVPIGPLRKFAAGGIAGGPTLGVIGEEGPEIVARMKPARQSDMGGGDIKQTIYLVDARPPRLGPNDVVRYVTADMRSGGKTADAVQNVIKRT